MAERSKNLRNGDKSPKGKDGKYNVELNHVDYKGRSDDGGKSE